MLEKKYSTVRTPEDVTLFLEHINTSDRIAFDTETNSLNMRKGEIIGFSVTGAPGYGFYVPTQIWDRENKQLVELTIGKHGAHKTAQKLLQLLKGKKLIMHNASFDIRFTNNFYGVDFLEDLWVDTALLVHTVQEDGAFGYGNPFGLKSIAIMNQEALGLDVESDANAEQLELKESIKANGGEVTKDNFEIYKADMDILSKYAASDTDLTFRICDLYMERLREEGLEKFFFEDEVMPIYKEVTIPMEIRGVMLDVPLLEKTLEEITVDLEENKKIVLKSLLARPETQDWIVDTSLSKFKPNNKGTWAQRLCERHKLPLPQSPKTGKYSLTVKNIETLEDSSIKTFLLDGDIGVLEPNEVLRISTDLWKDTNEGEYINIQSKDHLGKLVFQYFGEKPMSTTKKGKDKFDIDMLEELSKKYEWAENLRVYNKLLKVKSTYVDRFLDAHEDGIFYPYFKQNGTVSGRYGSDLQQLPKPKEDGEDSPTIVNYNNRVREFFISRPGMVFIDADYTSLEPHCFASVSGDARLQEIFNNGWDFYSTVAIQTEKLKGVSPDTSAPNFLKKVNPLKRNQAKSYALGIAYGMEDYALSKSLNISQKEAKKLVTGYLEGFPGLRDWRNESRRFVKENGYIPNKVGRIRHLPKVKAIHSKFQDKLMDWRFRKDLEERYGREEVMKLYRDYRNGLNNCLNYQLQSLAAAIVNRAAVQIQRQANALGVDAHVVAQVHDQLIIEVSENQAEEFAKVVKKCMEETTQLPGVTLKAPPEIAYNWREGH